MDDRERVIKTAAEDMDMGERLSAIRRGLLSEGYSPEEIHEIIADALELRKAERAKRQYSAREPAIVVFVFGLIVLVGNYIAAAPGSVYLVPSGLFGYAFYLWYKRSGDDAH